MLIRGVIRDAFQGRWKVLQSQQAVSCKHFIEMIKAFEAKTRKHGSRELEIVKVTGKTMIKALEYLHDLGYDEPDMIRLYEEKQAVPEQSG